MRPSDGLRGRWRVVAPIAVLALGFGASLVFAYLLNRPSAAQPLALYRTGHAMLTIDGGTATDLRLDGHGATLFAPGHAGLT